MRPRLIDIAQLSGVSEATVSRVLNGKEGLSDETRQAVLGAARELGRDISASPALREDVVGILVPDVDNPIFALWLERLEAELFETGTGALIATHARTVDREQQIFERFVRAGVRGVIVVSGFHAQDDATVGHYRSLVAQDIKLALINGVRDDFNATFISTDDDQAVRMAATHLRELGHTAIGLAVGDEGSWPVREKVRTFQELIDLEHWPAQHIAYTDFSYSGGFQAARDLITRGCTAIVCASDVMATGAYDAIRSLGLSVPHDVSVVGYDDAQWAGMIDPPLTTVRQNVREMARAAVRAVLERGARSRRPARTEAVVQPQLIVRSSTAAVPAAVPAAV